jgi:hypothetical protein
MRPTIRFGITKESPYSPKLSGPRSLATTIEEKASNISDMKFPVNRKKLPRPESSAISSNFVTLLSPLVHQLNPLNS